MCSNRWVVALDVPPVREVSVHHARVHGATLAHERQDRVGPALAQRRPARGSGTRLHQRVHGTRQKPIVDEDILLDFDLGITPLEVACSIAVDAVTKRQVLGARRRANRIGLHEAEACDGPPQCCRWKQAAAHCESPHILKSRLHSFSSSGKTVPTHD
jgi:hypothetical protein